MKTISDFFLKIIDFFLSPTNRASGETRMRARMLVFFLLFYGFLDVIALLSVSNLLGWLEYFGVWLSLITSVSLPFLIKKSYSPDTILLAAVTSFLLILVPGIAYSEFLNPNYLNGFLVMIWMSCLIANDLRIRVAALSMTFLGSIIALLSLSHKPDSYFHIAPEAGHATFANVLVNMIAQLVIFSMCLRIRSIAQDDLNQEIDWQQRLIELDELSSMTKAMRSLFIRPIESIRLDLLDLTKQPDASVLDRIKKPLDELLLISQSFSWIYRAHGRGGTYSLLSSSLLRQVEVLLSSKMEEEGWSFGIKHSGKPVEIYGPVPSLVLVLFTLIVQILEDPQPYEKRRLSLEFLQKGKWTIWKLTWPFDPDSVGNIAEGESSSRVALRKELIQDLTRACNANILHSHDQEQNARQILISGSWQRLKASGS